MWVALHQLASVDGVVVVPVVVAVHGGLGLLRLLLVLHWLPVLP